jgi:hypothetical protein
MATAKRNSSLADLIVSENAARVSPEAALVSPLVSSSEHLVSDSEHLQENTPIDPTGESKQIVHNSATQCGPILPFLIAGVIIFALAQGAIAVLIIVGKIAKIIAKKALDFSKAQMGKNQEASINYFNALDLDPAEGLGSAGFQSHTNDSGLTCRDGLVGSFTPQEKARDSRSVANGGRRAKSNKVVPISDRGAACII